MDERTRRELDRYQAALGDPHVKPAEYDFVAARRRLEAKPSRRARSSPPSRTRSARVKDGDHVAVGGCLFSRTPMALVREILRQRRTGLTLSRNLMCTEGEFLMVTGGVERVVTAWMSIGLPWGVSKILRHYVESGKVALEEWSHLALGLRFRAGAMGVPFLPALTMLGSDLMGVGGMKTIEDPYTGADAGRGARPLPRRGHPPRAPGRPLRQLPRSTATRTWTPTSRGPPRPCW